MTESRINPKMLAIIMVAVVVISAVAVYYGINKSEDAETELEEVHIQVMWVPNAQFAGYYVAMDKGYYKQEGLKVIINEYDENVRVKDVVAEGKAEFGIDGADQIIIGRSKGQLLTAVAVDYRLNPTAYASLKAAGITKPQDWEGKKIGMLPDSTGTIFKTMVSLYGLNETNLTYVPYGYDFNLLYNGSVDVIPVYLFDEPYLMASEGYELDVLLAYDYGIDFYGDTLFTTDKMIDQRPDLVRKMVTASLKGWQYAIENPDEAVEIILKYDHEDYHDLDYETYILTNEAPLVHTGEDRIGWMKGEVWQGMYDMLLDQMIIETEFNISEAYTTEFVSQT